MEEEKLDKPKISLSLIHGFAIVLLILSSIPLGITIYSFTKKGIDLEPVNFIALLLSPLVLIIGWRLTWLWANDKTKRRQLPPLWTGLGILGTFIALYIAFSSDLGLIKNGSVDEKAIEDLITTLAQAFSTSIIGIVMSLATNASISSIERKEKDKETKQIERTPHQLLYDIKEALSQSKDEQKVSVAGAIYSLHTSLVGENGVLVQVREQQKELMGLIKGRTSEGIPGISGHSSSQDTPQHLIGLLQGMYETTQKLPTDFQEKLDITIKELSGTINTYVGEIGEQGVSDAKEANNQLIKSIQELAKSNELILKQSDKGIKDALKSLKNTVNKQYEDQLEAIQTAFDDRLKTITSSFQEESEKMGNSLTETQTKISEEITAIKIAFDDSVKGIENTFRNEIGGLEGVAYDFADHTSANIEGIQNSFSASTQSLSEELRSSTQHIKEGIADAFKLLEETNSGVAQRVTQVVEENISTLKNTINTLERWQKETQIAFESSVNKFDDSVQQHNRLGNINQELLDTMKEQLEQLQILQSQSTDILTGIDNYEERVEAIERQIQALENIGGTLETIQTRLS